MSRLPVCFDVLTPVSFLSRSAVVYGDKVAVVHNQTRYTYQEFYARVKRLSWALLNAGIHKGDKVAIICPNIPHMLEAHFAVPMIGASLVPINTRLASPEISYILQHSGARLLLVDNEFAHLVIPVLGELGEIENHRNHMRCKRREAPAGTGLRGVPRGRLGRSCAVRG